MDRKMSTSTEQLCKGYATEFRSYFEYCRSLRFEDRPDYAYLKRLFKELFYRKGFQYDNMFDWTVLNLVRDPSRNLERGAGGERICLNGPVCCRVACPVHSNKSAAAWAPSARCAWRTLKASGNAPRRSV